MVDQIKRQHLLKGGTVAAALALYTSWPGTLSPGNHKPSLTLQTQTALGQALATWQSLGQGTPSSYLLARGVLDKTQNRDTLFHRETLHDFKTRQVVSVDGLVLAKIEVAALAYMAETAQHA